MAIKNKVLDQLKENKPSLGGWVMTSSITCAEIMAQAGYDWVCVDAEHSPVNYETVQNMFIVIERHGAEPFVRIPENDEVVFKKYLDMGAKGIIVPMVNSAEEVEKAIAYANYSPQGIRSFALPRANGYGAFAEEYFQSANDNLFLGIMIEHIDALKNLDEIFSNKRIDAVFVGPYDLSGSMDIPGQFDNMKFKQALNLIRSKAQKHGVTMGIHDIYPTVEKIQKYINDGYRFIACGIDTLYVREMSEKFVSAKK